MAVTGRRPVGVVIVGAGQAAELHDRWYRQMPEVKVLAYVDLDEQRARARAEAFGLQGRGTYYVDYHEALRRPDVDVCDVMPSPAAQPAIAIDALHAGKHVLVEKPMAQSLAQCDAMIEAARQHGLVLGQIHQNRVHRTPRRVQLLLESGRLGATVRARGFGSTVHLFDTVRFLLGAPAWCIADWSGPIPRASGLRPPRWLNGVVHFQSGISCSIEAGSDDPMAVPQQFDRRTRAHIELVGDRLSVSFGWAHNQVRLRGDWDGANHAYVSDTQAWFDSLLPDTPEADGHGVLLPAFVRAVQDGGKPLLTGEDGRQAIELVTGLYKAAATGERTAFPISSDDPFYADPQAGISIDTLTAPGQPLAPAA